MYLRLLILSLIFGLSVLSAQAQQSSTPPIPNSEGKWYPVQPNQIREIAGNAVLSHMRAAGGVEDFYRIPPQEISWLTEMGTAEQDWMVELQNLEGRYRESLNEVILSQIKRRNWEMLRKQYDDAIATLRLHIGTLNRQLAEIDKEEKGFLRGLSGFTLSSLVAVRVPFTEDLPARLRQQDLGDQIFLGSTQIAQAALKERYASRVAIPFRSGVLRTTYLYPENISRFDEQVGEYVYLFHVLEISPFAQSERTGEAPEQSTAAIRLFQTAEEVRNYLQQERVGDQRLLNWAQGELAYQSMQNDNAVESVLSRLDYFQMRRRGPRQMIQQTLEQIQELEQQRDSLPDDSALDEKIALLNKAEVNYRDHYSSRVVPGYEKYTMEYDMMYLSNKPTQGVKEAVPVMKDSKKSDQALIDLPISSRKLQDIYRDMLVSVYARPQQDTSQHNQPIFRVNDDLSGMEEGRLRWDIAGQDFRLLKLSRGNIGSRNQYVLHLATRTTLRGNPIFPPRRYGTCDFTVYFGPQDFALDPEDLRTLAKASDCLKRYSRQSVAIVGHTDYRQVNKPASGVDNNVILGMKRASTVFEFFANKGFNSRRFEVSSMGARQPAVRTNSAEDLSKNRRVRILSLPPKRGG